MSELKPWFFSPSLLYSEVILNQQFHRICLCQKLKFKVEEGSTEFKSLSVEIFLKNLSCVNIYIYIYIYIVYIYM